MHNIEQKSAFLIITTVDPMTFERKYLFMNACQNSTNPDKVALWGGMADDGEHMLTGLWRELKEELSEQAANLLLNGKYEPAYIHDEQHIIDRTVKGREDWWDSHDYIYAVEVTPEDFDRLYTTALKSTSSEVNGATILTQTQIEHGLQTATLPMRYAYEINALRRYQNTIGSNDPILLLEPN